MYLAVVKDLYSRRIVGWEISKRMTTNLVERALVKAINVRRPKRGLVFQVTEVHSTPAGAFELCCVTKA